MSRTLFLLLAAAASCAAQSTPSARLEGTWLGTLGNGSNAISLVCHFEKTTAGALSGTINSLASGVDNNIESVTVTGQAIRFEVKRIKGSFAGAMQQDGKQIDGVWIQPGLQQPLVLTRTEKTSVMLPEFKGVDVLVPKAPTAVRAGGREWLYYEVHITNWSDLEMTLLRLELLIGDEVVAIEGDALKSLAVAAGLKLAPGIRSVVLVPAAGDQFPDFVRHRVTFQLAGEAQPRTVECAKTPVLRGPVQIAPPLAGGLWQAAAGPDTNRHHRGALIDYKGRATISQRFAFDFFLQERLDAPSAGGDPLDNKSHPSYGAPVLAVADAIVASVVDGIPENIPYDIFPAVPLTPEKMYGNRVTLDLGLDRYATYGHLQPGLRVKAGDKVRAGQLLGLIGNSGRSGSPHLHFQVTDGPDPIASEGIPFVIASFSRNGTRYSDEMPLNDWIIAFARQADGIDAPKFAKDSRQ